MSDSRAAKPPFKESANINRDNPSNSYPNDVRVFVDLSTLSVRRQAIDRVKSAGIFKAPPSKPK
jgi:hypothetical protein